LTIFVWTFVAHEFIGLGEVGVREIVNEAAVRSEEVAEDGLTTWIRRLF